MPRFRIWMIIAGILLPGMAARSQQIFFEQLTAAEGLPSDYVNCIYRDSKGYLWIGTDKGACRYDGKTFQYFNVDNGLESNFISCIEEDSKGNIWIGTMKGIGIYDGQYIKKFQLPDKNDQFVLQLNFNNDNSFFIVTYEGVLYYFINENEKPTAFRKCHYIRCLSDNLYVAALNNDLYQVELKNRQLLFSKVYKDYVRNGVSLNRSNSLFLAYKKGNTVMNCIIEDGQLFPSEKYVFNKQIPLPPYYYIKTILAGDRELFLGTTHGLIYLNPDNQTFLFNSESGLGTNYIRYLYRDRQGKLYIGTYGSGIKIWPRGYLSRFSVNGKVTSLFPSADGFLITTSKKVYRLHPQSGQLTELKIPYAKGNFTNIYYDVNGPAFLGTMNGYYRFSSVQQINNHHSSSTITPGLAYSGTSGFAILGTKTFISTYGDGLLVFSKNKKNADTLKTHTVPPGAPIIEFLVPLQTSVAALTYDNGLIIYDTAYDYTRISLEQGLLSKTVYAVFQENEKEIWIGTQSGLNLFDGKKIIRTYSKEQGLYGSKVISIFRDRMNRLWILSDKYLHLHDDDRLRAIRSCPVLFDEKNTINRAVFNKETNTLVIGLTDAVLAVDMSRVLPDTLVTTPALVSIKKDTTNILQHGATSVSLSHPASKILFQFRNPDFSITGRYDIHFKLSGFDDEWNQLTASNEVVYQKLPAGEYELLAKTINPDGYASPEYRLVALKVLPPVWKRTWFLAAMSALVLGIFFYIGHLLSRRKYKKNLAILQEEYRLQLERERIARELHDNVGSQLTFLINKIDDDYTELSKNTDAAQLGSVARNAMQELRETIWALDKKEVPWEDMEHKVKQLMNLYRGNSQQVNLKWQINNQQQPLNPLEALNIYRIIQESLNNASKYSHAGKVNILVQQHNGSLLVEIADNGKGFDMNNTEPGYGFKNMKKRAEEMKARLEIYSIPENGTTIRLHFS